MFDEENQKKPRTTIENLQLSKAQRKELNKLGVEKLEEYRKNLNIMASSPAGKFFLQSLISALGVYKPVDVKQGVDVIVKRNVYLENIRPYLTDEIRRELEADVR